MKNKEISMCEFDGCAEPAVVDGKTRIGPWANMCELHFQKYGIGLGTGKGQKIEGAVETVKASEPKVEDTKPKFHCGHCHWLEKTCKDEFGCTEDTVCECTDFMPNFREEVLFSVSVTNGGRVKKELRAQLQEYKGRIYAVVRVWYFDNGAKEYMPSKNGLNILLEDFPNVVEAAKAIIEESNKLQGGE